MRDNKESKDVAEKVFRLSLFVLAFLVGGLCAYASVFPFNLLSKGYQDTLSLVRELTRTKPELVVRRTFLEDGVTIIDKEKVYPGLTVMQGWFSDGVQLRLVNIEGAVLHKWMIDFHRIWPTAEHIVPARNVPKTSFNYHTQGMEVLPDGSIVANIPRAGTFKMDKCGKILWTLDRMTHHSITPTDDGGFWIPAYKSYKEIDDELLFGEATRKLLAASEGRYEDLLLHVDQNGRVVKEISVLESIVDAGMEHQLFDAVNIKAEDPTHVNDIEEVTPELADSISGVHPGDLLVSVRNFHMLAILDVKTGRLKWHQIGPWVRQHDPDIMANGNITVFNNRHPRFFVMEEWGSNIIQHDARSGESRPLYPSVERPAVEEHHGRFFTDIMGSHQVLPNGNIMIVETRKGRVFEVDQDGNIVWQYISSYNEQYAALIEDAERLKHDYFQVKDWSCGQAS